MNKPSFIFPQWHNRLEINKDDYDNRVKIIKSEFKKKINLSLLDPDKHNVLIKNMINHIRDDDKRIRINYNYGMKSKINVFLKTILKNDFTGCNTWCNYCYIYGPLHSILEHMVYSHQQKNYLKFCPFCYDTNINLDKFDITNKDKDTAHLLICAIRVNHPTFKYFNKISVHIWKVFCRLDKKYHNSRPSSRGTFSYHINTICDQTINFSFDPIVYYEDYLKGYAFIRIEKGTLQLYKSLFANTSGFIIYDMDKINYTFNSKKRKNVGVQATMVKNTKKYKSTTIRSIINTEVIREDCMCNIENNIFYEIGDDNTNDSGIRTDYEDEIEEQLKKIFEVGEEPSVSIEITHANEQSINDMYNITYNVTVGDNSRSLSTQFRPTTYDDIINLNNIDITPTILQSHQTPDEVERGINITNLYGIGDTYSALQNIDELIFKTEDGCIINQVAENTNRHLDEYNCTLSNEYTVLYPPINMNDINIDRIVGDTPLINTEYYNDIVDELDLDLLRVANTMT